jgi:membrane fusion protein (multidrug efflux system)
MKKYYRLKNFSYVLLLFILSLAGCSKEEEVVADKKLPLVKTQTVNVQPFSEYYNIVGVVKPIEEATVSAVEGGLITYLQVDKGSRIGRGQVLVRLRKDVEYAVYQQTLSQYELAKSNYDRIERLYLEGVSTEQEYTNAKLNLDIAEKSIGVTEERLKNAVVTSPINGIVDQKFMNKGETAPPGSPILKIVNVSRVKVSTGIPERFLPDIAIGTQVDISFSVFPGEVFSGRVNYISPTINKINRTFEIEVEIQNPQGRFKPEMSANLSVLKYKIDDAIVLPQDIVVDLGNEKYLFVYDNGVAKRRTVTLGGYSGNNVHITSGLKKGDIIITEGFQSLADGDKVTILE